MIRPDQPPRDHGVDLDLVRRLERSRAISESLIVDVLQQLDPSWKAQTFPLADGQAVLCGAGLYVNQAIALGLVDDVDDAALAELATRSREVGVPIAVEVGPATHEGLVARCTARDMASAGEVSVLIRAVVPDDAATEDDVDGLSIEVVDRRDAHAIATWQATSAEGWGHVTPARRRASDAYAAAAVQRPGERLLLARSVLDGSVLGCASITVHERIATLGGMSTRPAARRRGVQAALVRARMRMAAASGCDIAATSAVLGGDSERNLQRLGFAPAYTKSVWRGPEV